MVIFQAFIYILLPFFFLKKAFLSKKLNVIPFLKKLTK